MSVTVSPDAPCPCGSSRAYESCCQPFLSGAAQPATAEQLMRSRYSAFVTGTTDYIHATLAPEARDESYDPAHIEDWAKNSQWLGLEVLSTEAGGEADSEGYVEFVARFRYDGQERAHHETSRFAKRDGKWLYVDGSLGPRPRRVQKIGRNDPCTCGSGKKYKKCCGAAA